MDSNLYLRTYCPIRAQNAGLLISRGTAMHPTRVIATHELIFVRQGELDMWEEDQVFHLEAGQTLHLFPGRQHGSTRSMPAGLKFYWIHFEVEEETRKVRAGDEFVPPLKLPQMATIQQPERLERLFCSFLDDQETGMLHQHSANFLTMMMLIEITQAVEEKTVNPGDSYANVVATRAHTHIRINYDRPITAGKVAEAVGYNADYLGRIYRNMYGCTLTEAIHRRRIGKACDFLLDKNLTIEQIAPMCGFTDPDYFRRVFRRYMQVAPGDYRNEFAHMHVNTDDPMNSTHT
jgi:AraC-like DNA-binding protein